MNQKHIIETSRSRYYNERSYLVSLFALAIVGLIAILNLMQGEILFKILFLVIGIFCFIVVIIVLDRSMTKKIIQFTNERHAFVIDIEKLVFKTLYNVISDPKIIRDEYFKILFHHSNISSFDFSSIFESQKLTIE